MKQRIIIVGIVCLVVNLLLGLSLKAYSDFNMGLNCGVIIVNTLLFYSLYSIDLHDVFKVALGCLVALLAVAEIVLGVVAPCCWPNNWPLVAIVVALMIEAILLAIMNGTSVEGKEE
jgi:hypothetical protein